MRLPCIWCKESFSSCDFFGLLYSDEGIYYFCSLQFRDSQASPVVPENEFENLPHPAI